MIGIALQMLVFAGGLACVAISLRMIHLGAYAPGILGMIAGYLLIYDTVRR